jgi:transcriptional regulator with XRE-family HTH domain
MSNQITVEGIMCQISANVKRIREKLGLSQKELADRIGVSFPRISEIENGKGEPRITTIEKVARGLGVSVLDLLRPSKKN